jgi:membrane protein CcdC involved in cytochrome C biogenesis
MQANTHTLKIKIFSFKKGMCITRYIHLSLISWYVRITGLFLFSEFLMVTWTIPWGVSMSCSYKKIVEGLRKAS